MIHENLEEIYAKKNKKTKPGRTEKAGVFKVLDWKQKSTGS